MGGRSLPPSHQPAEKLARQEPRPPEAKTTSLSGHSPPALPAFGQMTTSRIRITINHQRLR
jgi:hypothetical protein